MSAAKLGTLMWIGTTVQPEFEAAFDYGCRHAAQVAVRDDLDQALKRPAAAVGGIVLARPTRAPIDPNALDKLQQAYPDASILQLMGAHCEGMKADVPAAQRLYWHRWREVIPAWLSRFGAAPQPETRRCHCVAVVASHYAAAEALLELAESTGVATVWLSRIDHLRVRNVDAVWWDDSLADPTTAEGWGARVAGFARQDKAVRHAWIVSAPRYDQHRAAIEGGIEVIASKPYRTESLLHMLAAGSQSPSLALRAA